MLGPTVGATEEPSAWAPRRWSARALRVAIVVVPFLISFGAALAVRPLLPHPPGLTGALQYFVPIVAVSVLTALATERLLQRLLPLASLLELSLVFPDQVPSRFSVALRSGTTKRLSSAVADVTQHQFSSDENEAVHQVLTLLQALRRHEPLTRGHSERVRAYCDLIAIELGMSEDERQRLQWAVLLHDIGKLSVPAGLLNKNGPPTAEEWNIIKQHPVEGARMAEPLRGWLGDFVDAAGQHHERFDGSGYPHGLEGTDISLAGRIVAVADAYDVITSRRSYKSAMSAPAARTELVNSAGSHFDPRIVKAMLHASVGKISSLPARFSWLLHLPSVLRPAGVALAGATMAAAAVAMPTPTPLASEPAALAFGETPEPTVTVSTSSLTPTVTASTSPITPVAAETPEPPEPEESLGTSEPTNAVPPVAPPETDLTPQPVATTERTTTPAPTTQAEPEALPVPPLSQPTTPPAEPTPTPALASTSESTPTAEPTATAETAAEPTPTPEPTATLEPTSTPEPTATPAPTATPTPTATPAPTATPTPTPTPLSPCELAKIGETELAGFDLTGCTLAGLTLTGVNLADANLAGADLTNAEISSFSLAGASLTNANLTGTRFTDGSMVGADLAGVIGDTISIVRVDLAYTTLTNTTLTNATITDASFGFAMARDADFTGAVMRGVNFNDADISGTTFAFADITGTELWRTSAVSTDLTSTIVSGVVFGETDLSAAIGTPTNGEGATYFGVICPDGLISSDTCWP